MTSKIFSKTVKKVTLWSVILGVVISAAIVVCAIFGFHKDVTVSDYKTLTVSLDSIVYQNDKEDVIEICEDAFKGVDAKYHIDGEAGDAYEIVFVFEKDAKLENVKNALQATFDSLSADDKDVRWSGYDFYVSEATEEVERTGAKHFELRAIIAGAVFAVFAFAYVAIRYKSVLQGAVVGASVALGMLSTMALIALTRTIVTEWVASVILSAGLLTAASVLLTVGKIRAKQKEDAQLSNEEAVVSSIAVKETSFVAVSLIIAVILVGIFGKTAAAWFAVSAIIGVVASTLVSLVFAPAMYLSVKGVIDRKPKKAYSGKKKTSRKEKKAAQVEETPVADSAEEPVAEATAEETAMQPVAETEVAEEETATDETPVEEEAEEAVEEKEEE